MPIIGRPLPDGTSAARSVPPVILYPSGIDTPIVLFAADVPCLLFVYLVSAADLMSIIVSACWLNFW